MKVFKVTAEDYNWDEYVSVVIVAESPEEAIKIATTENSNIRTYAETGFVQSGQGKFTVEEVDLDTKGVILAHYHAG